MATNIIQLSENGQEVLLGEGFNQIPSMLPFKNKQNLLKYFFHVLHPASVLYGLELQTRINRARAMLELTKKETEELEVLKALSDLESTLEADVPFKMLRSVTEGINSLTYYFSNVDFDKTIQVGQQAGKLVHDPKTLIAGAKEARTLLKELESLRKEVLETMKIVEEKKARGGVERSAFAKFAKQ